MVRSYEEILICVQCDSCGRNFQVEREEELAEQILKAKGWTKKKIYSNITYSFFRDFCPECSKARESKLTKKEEK